MQQSKSFKIMAKTTDTKIICCKGQLSLKCTHSNGAGLKTIFQLLYFCFKILATSLSLLFKTVISMKKIKIQNLHTDCSC